MSDAPIFLVGAARSGTTLLQYMLRSHPQISLPTGESHFFIPFYQRREEFGDLSKKNNLQNLLSSIYRQKAPFFDEELHGIKFNVDEFTDLLYKQGLHTVPQIINGIMSANAAGEGKQRWGDKTPYYILHLETLLEMFPDAQFVHIIRDGRDCALSMLERKWDLKIFNTYHAAYLWNRYVEHGVEFGRKYPDIYIELRYEDLLAEPEKNVERLCNFLNIEYSESVINFRKSDGSGKTSLLTQPLQKNNSEKWRTKMSDRQVRVFEALAGDMLAQNDYPLATENHHLSVIEEALYNAHIRLFQLFS
ncbi:MAG: sulfotransferase [Chromatiales bacterium]|jgi:hypothetical protein